MDSGLSGAITSIAPSPTVMASTALDRFVRIHCTPLPPQQAGQQVEKKGEILDKVYVKSIPTVIIWDGDIARDLNVKPEEEKSDSEDGNVWDGMEDVDDSDGDETGSRTRPKRNKKSRAG